ncbi:MAG: cytochrome c [Gammaproteobacteria bacterium]|nr:cytochrome c [Gammaproteobacteria bacterium]
MRSWVVACMLLALGNAGGAYAEAPNLGQILAPNEVVDLTVFADGSGLPAGSGSVAQGKLVYEQQCMVCHGMNGVNGINAPLAGGSLPNVRTIGSYWPYATSIFDYVQRAMPYATPGTLSVDDTYAVVGYLLFLNNLLDSEVQLDAARLARITLPNADNFFSEYPLP